MEYSRLSILPIPASIRRRLLRLYSYHKAVIDDKSSGALYHGISSSSEPLLTFQAQSSGAIPIETQRPSTASDDLDSSDSGSRGSDSPRIEDAGSPVKYETESGLRWNRVVPGENMQWTKRKP